MAMLDESLEILESEFSEELSPTKVVTMRGMTTKDDLLRAVVVEPSYDAFVTCDLSMSLRHLKDDGFAPVTTYDVAGFPYSEGEARLDPDNPSHIQLFLVQVESVDVKT